MLMPGVARPSGLWLRGRRSASSPPPGPHVRAVPEHPSDTRLLLGAPGEPLPGVADVAGVVRRLDEARRARLVVVVYGPEPHEEVSVAQQLADELGQPVRARHGLVLGAPGALARTTTVDASGRPAWAPFARLSTYRPGGSGAGVVRWRTPAPGLRPTAPHVYDLCGAWELDVVPAGVVVRPMGAAPDPRWAAAPAHPDRVDLVVDLRDETALTDGALSALGRFADALPGVARERLRVVLSRPLGERPAMTLRWAVPAPQVVALASGPALGAPAQVA